MSPVVRSVVASVSAAAGAAVVLSAMLPLFTAVAVPMAGCVSASGDPGRSIAIGLIAILFYGTVTCGFPVCIGIAAGIGALLRNSRWQIAAYAGAAFGFLIGVAPAVYCSLN